MPKPSGIKSTHFIDTAAEWFAREVGYDVCVSYMACSSNIANSQYKLWCWDGTNRLGPPPFKSFSAMRQWMEGEIRRRKVLFRRF